MKRHPKRARPLWGKRREITGPPIRWTGLTFTFPEGTYVDGGVDDIASTQPGSTTFIVRGHDVNGAEIVETLTVPDGEQGVTTLAFADATINVMSRTPPGGSALLHFDSPGGTAEEFNRAIKTVNEVRAELGLPGIAAPLGDSTIDALSRAISEGLQSKGEHEVTVTVTVTGDMTHATAEYVPSYFERVQFFEAVHEMTIDPGTVLVLPPCEVIQ